MGLILLFYNQQGATPIVTATRRRYVDDPSYAVAIGNRLPMNVVDSDPSTLPTTGNKDGDVLVGRDTSDQLYVSSFNGETSLWETAYLDLAVDGELYTHENSVVITVTTAGTYYVITGLTAGLSKGTGYLTLDATNGTMTIGAKGAGRYRLTGHISAFSNKVANLEFAIYLNGVKQDNCSVKRDITTANQEGAIPITGLLSLSANDVIDIRVTSSANSTNVSLDHFNFNLLRYSK